MDDKFFIKGYEAAGFKIRLVASFIDNVILMIPLLFLAQYFNIDTKNNDLGSFLLNISIVIAFVSMWVYWGGKTPGKALLKLKIISVDPNSDKIDIFHGIIRYFGYIVSTIFFFIGFIIIGFRKDKRGLHDLMSDTCVVYEK